jgi:hypothetical protein
MSPFTVITPSDSWRICRQCITTDLENIGVGYIRRHHLLSSIKVCDLHGLSLDDICPSCNIHIKNHSNSSFRECAKLYTLNKSESKTKATNIEYSKFVRELLLHSKFHTPDFPHVKHAIDNQLLKLGYVLDGNIQWNNVCADINNCLGGFTHKNKLDFSISQLHPTTSLGSIAKIAFFAFRTTDAYWQSIRDTIDNFKN